MSGDQYGNLIYLLLLGAVLVSYMIVANRRQLGSMVRNAALWVFIFLGAIAAVGLWNDLRHDIAPRQSVMQEGTGITVPRSQDGHYYLTLDVNGKSVRFIVDTGATEIVLSRNDAARIGLNVDSLVYSGRAFTANGIVQTAPVRLERIGFGGIEESGIRAVVNNGEMSESLLGMSYLNRFSTLSISNGTLTLER